jgi:endonuclease G
MKFLNPSRWLVVAIVFFVVACSEDIEPGQSGQPGPTGPLPPINTPVAGSYYENFETGSKPSYLSGSVTLTSGSWFLSDALIGNTTLDQKTGKQSVRIRNTGVMSMNLDLTSGASDVRVVHAKYGTDESSDWELWMAVNSSSTYTKVGNTVTSATTTLTSVSFTVNVEGTVTFEIRKVSGGENRINIDEFEVIPFGTEPPPPPAAEDNTSLLFGNPSDATTDVANENNYLMDKTYYALSYNRSRAIPNWVAWYVGPSTLGGTKRQDDFRSDTSLPAGWYRVGSGSFGGSGFDRGHNCPSGDRTASVEANSSTFFMTNMIPQAPNNNQQTWANLESYARTLVNAGNEVYIIMGNYGVGGTGSNGAANTVDAGRVTVPNRVWKVIVVIAQGNNDLSRVTTTTRVIAIDTPNTNTISSSWGTYRTSVDAIETATGYNLLSALPDDIETVLESKVDTGPTN